VLEPMKTRWRPGAMDEGTASAREAAAASVAAEAICRIFRRLRLAIMEVIVADEAWGAPICTCRRGWPHRAWCAKSQDVHTPRVIASDFLEEGVRGFILRSSARRRPETLLMMDEVDGRPGFVALQFGHMNAPQDVPLDSLCLSIPSSRQNHKTHRIEDLPLRRGSQITGETA
jgi:hypothetical protein